MLVLFMPRKKCNCQMASVLPRGVVCNRGYLFIRLFPNYAVKPFLKGCGPHNRTNEKLACIQISKHREAIMLGKFDMEVSAPSITVHKAVEIYMAYKDFTAVSRANTKSILKVALPFFAHMLFDKVRPMHAEAWRVEQEKTLAPNGKPVAFSTVNRRQRALQSVWSTIINWSKLEKPFLPKIKLPENNPFSFVERPSEKPLARRRVPSRIEFRQAKAWCMGNDPELWEIIVRAVATFLRASDFKRANASGAQEGIQGKTGGRFITYTAFPSPVDLTNWRSRWNALQAAMGWDKEGTAEHTVWHDLRHCGPTILGEQGWSTKQIQQLTGHASESMADRYTHLRPEKLKEAAETVEREMREL